MNRLAISPTTIDCPAGRVNLPQCRRRSRWIIAALVIVASVIPGSAEEQKSGWLRAGAFFWEPELSPAGPVVIVISLPDQTLSAYRNGIRIGFSSISSGTKGRSTPAGVFTILEKQVVHFSNKYHHAPMPYMQRLTWEGVALHGGDLPGYPASHGCIRLPRAFASKLYSITDRGTTVIVVDEKKSEPTIATHPGIVLSGGVTKANAIEELSGEFDWNPERSEEGPVTVLASAADKTIYVFRNGILIGCGKLAIYEPEKPLGSHAFTMLEGLGEEPSAIVPDRPAHRWLDVRTEGRTTLAELAARADISPEFAEKLYDILSPGTTVVVTDAPALRATPSAHSIFLMEASPAKK